MEESMTAIQSFLRYDLLTFFCIYAACMMVALSLEKRSHFTARVVLSACIPLLWMYGTRVYMLMLPNSMQVSIARFAMVFVLTGLTVPICSVADFCQSMYAITVAYSIQNLCERLIEIPRYSLAAFPAWLDVFCHLTLQLICLGIYYHVLIGGARQRTMFDFSTMNSRVMLFLGVSVVAISVVLDIILRGETPPGNLVMQNGLNIMSAVFSFLTIVVCMSHLRETDSERRMKISAQMLYSEQQRYEQDKQVHDAINIKCHDIRHQIAALGEDAYGGELRKIGKLVDIYDSAPRTHCAALDVVLAGKTLACTTQGIALTCLADGRRLGFMEDCDIYALFGNIMDNAIEAASQVEDPERRMISLNVGTSGDLMRIEALNFFSGALSFEEGLPVTTKQDSDYHGFGTRSIRTLTEKYDGDLQIAAEDGVFRLSILLPVPETV